MRLPLHPVALSAYPILYLYAVNVGKMSVAETVLPLAFSWAIVAGVWISAAVLLANRNAGAIAATLFVAVFYLAGPAYHAGREAGAPMPVVLLALGTLIAVAGCAVVYTRDRLGWLSTFLNIGSGVALVLLLMPAMAYSLSPRNGSSVSPIAVQPGSQKPDIYYIVVDGYGRSDVLRELYGFDNGPFIRQLEDLGFYVASRAIANYAQTLLSLASTLNMMHLQDVAGRLGQDARDRGVLRDLIARNRVVAALKQLDYEVVTFSSGYSGTDRLNDVDTRLAPAYALSEFQNLLLAYSPLPPLFERLGIGSMREMQFEAHRRKVRYVFDSLAALPKRRRPRFVFAHVVSPHPPFVFGAAGESKTPPRDFSFADASHYVRNSDRDEYIRGYVDQARYISARVAEAAGAITVRQPDAVIIVQSDHGPGAYLRWADFAASNMRERMSILNALRVPASVRVNLNPRISPVNSFRLLFRELFGAPTGPLADHAYFSEWRRPYKFSDVTAEVVADGTEYSMVEKRVTQK
jgi:hypothetical protein